MFLVVARADYNVVVVAVAVGSVQTVVDVASVVLDVGVVCD